MKKFAYSYNSSGSHKSVAGTPPSWSALQILWSIALLLILQFLAPVLSAFTVTMAASTTIAPSIASAAAPEGGPSIEQLEAEGVVSKYSPDLMKIPGVWGVGASGYPDGHMYVSVHVVAITPEIKSRVPTTLGGFPVEFIVGPVPHFLGNVTPRGQAPK